MHFFCFIPASLSRREVWIFTIGILTKLLVVKWNSKQPLNRKYVASLPSVEAPGNIENWGIPATAQFLHTLDRSFLHIHNFLF